MASLTQWTWVLVNSRSWRWTGRPGVLQSMGSQRVRHDWATELNWILLLCDYSETLSKFYCYCSFTKLCLTLRDPVNCSMPGLPVLHCLLEFAQVHVCCVRDTIRPSHPLLPSPLAVWPSNSTPKYIPKEIKACRQTKAYTWIFIAALFKIATKWK